MEHKGSISLEFNFYLQTAFRAFFAHKGTLLWPESGETTEIVRGVNFQLLWMWAPRRSPSRLATHGRSVSEMVLCVGRPSWLQRLVEILAWNSLEPCAGSLPTQRRLFATRPMLRWLEVASDKPKRLQNTVGCILFVAHRPSALRGAFVCFVIFLNHGCAPKTTRQRACRINLGPPLLALPGWVMGRPCFRIFRQNLAWNWFAMKQVDPLQQFLETTNVDHYNFEYKHSAQISIKNIQKIDFILTPLIHGLLFPRHPGQKTRSTDFLNTTIVSRRRTRTCRETFQSKSDAENVIEFMELILWLAHCRRFIVGKRFSQVGSANENAKFNCFFVTPQPQENRPSKRWGDNHFFNAFLVQAARGKQTKSFLDHTYVKFCIGLWHNTPMPSQERDNSDGRFVLWGEMFEIATMNHACFDPVHTSNALKGRTL